ncbi:MAG: tetratricopeptide repeat protein, partial [Synechococcus sp.]
MRQLFSAALTAMNRGEQAEALRLQRQVVAWARTHLGSDHPFLALALNNLATYLGPTPEALGLTQEAADIYEKLAKDEPKYRRDIALTLFDLAVIHGALGNDQAALRSLLSAVQLRRELAREQSDSDNADALAQTLLNLGNISSGLGLKQEALAATAEAVVIFRNLSRAKPQTSSDLARALANLSIRHSNLGRHGEALKSAQEAVSRFRELAQANRDGQQDLAQALNILFQAQRNLGQRQQALQTIQESVRTLRLLQPASQGGKERLSDELGLALNNLGIASSDLGRSQEALAPTLEALSLFEHLAVHDRRYRPRLALIQLNLGRIHGELGQFNKALPWLEQSAAIGRELAQHNPLSIRDLAFTLNNLALIYSRLQRHQQALEMTRETVDIRRRLAQVNAGDRADLALSLNNLGVRFSDLGRKREALAPTQEAVTLYRVLLATNPLYAEGFSRSATNLAALQVAAGRPAAALPLLQDALQAEVGYLRGQLPLLPEDRREALVELFGDRWQVPFSLAQQGVVGAELAMVTRLNRQGLLLEIQRSQALLGRSGPYRSLVEQVQAVSAELLSPTLSSAERQQRITLKERLELDLRQRLGITLNLVSLAQVRQAMPASAALLEFQRYRTYDSNNPPERRWGAERYLALLLKPDGRVRAMDLGKAAPIDTAVAWAVKASGGHKGNASERLQSVSDLLLPPLRQELAGVRELFVSPDAELNRLPFAALPMPGAPGVPVKLLSEAFQLRLLTSGRDLVRLQQPGRSGGPALLVANPEFGAGSSTSGTGTSGTGTNSRAAAEAPWKPLPGTALEATQLAPLLQVPRPLTGREATTANVLASRNPRILHIASHGFFWSEQEARDQARSCGADISGAQRSAPSAQSSAGIDSTTATGNTPIAPAAPTTSQTFAVRQRSGSVLAGANQPCRSAEQDGYLTAAEVTGMDLE